MKPDPGWNYYFKNLELNDVLKLIRTRIKVSIYTASHSHIGRIACEPFDVYTKINTDWLYNFKLYKEIHYDWIRKTRTMF